jgi:hypothetical protein
VTSVNVPSITPAVTIGGLMLFWPSAYFMGAAGPVAWHRALTEDGLLLLQLKEAREPAFAAHGDLSEHQHQGERVDAVGPAEEPAARGLCHRLPTGAADALANPRVLAVMEASGANLRPRLTGPLLPCAVRRRRARTRRTLRRMPASAADYPM